MSTNPPIHSLALKTIDNSKELDQFYTNTIISKKCMSFLSSIYKLDDFFLLEPSAGTGSFSDQFHKNSIAYDIDPKKDYIERADFLDLSVDILPNKQIFTIGNPPFGKNSSLAIKFFNKSAMFSEYIAFIVPKTFNKISVTNKLDLNFSKVKEFELPLDSFVFQNSKYSVPCVFQVWKKMDVKRDKVKTRTKSELFEFSNKSSSDFAIRRVGRLAGKFIDNFQKYQESSHYFIKVKKNKVKLKREIKNLFSTFNNQARNCASNPSLSKHEFINLVEASMLNGGFPHE